MWGSYFLFSSTDHKIFSPSRQIYPQNPIYKPFLTHKLFALFLLNSSSPLTSLPKVEHQALPAPTSSTYTMPHKPHPKTSAQPNPLTTSRAAATQSSCLCCKPQRPTELLDPHRTIAIDGSQLSCSILGLHYNRIAAISSEGARLYRGFATEMALG